jgi:2',3'-cyclic-nucleotide 2'-phosphodiesterase (5'-nucleotidase family)
MAAYTNPNTTGNCFGGYARRKALIDEIRANETNVLVLDPGNYFQGTL